MPRTVTIGPIEPSVFFPSRRDHGTFPPDGESIGEWRRLRHADYQRPGGRSVSGVRLNGDVVFLGCTKLVHLWRAPVRQQGSIEIPVQASFAAFA